MKILKSPRGFDNSIYNLGAGKKYSGSTLIKTISKIISKKIFVSKNQRLVRAVDRKVLVANITKFAKNYSWKPQFTIYQGLKKLIKLELKK